MGGIAPSAQKTALAVVRLVQGVESFLIGVSLALEYMGGKSPLL